jgi:hypothetical protein
LLHFLEERTRLDWFKHKLRWRLSKRYIWPGAPEGLTGLLDEAIEKDGGVEAFMAYLRTQQRAITAAIERYNLALLRYMEQERGVPAEKFDEASRTELHQRRITFQGTREELLRRARGLRPDSGPELLPDLLSLRLALLTEDVRAGVFAEVAAQLAKEESASRPDLSPEALRHLAEATALRLRSLDQFHVARLLAESYPEARRLMDVDDLLHRYEAQRREEFAHPGVEPGRAEELEVLRNVLLDKITFLADLFPITAGTHDREISLLRQPSSPGGGEREQD